LLCHGNAGNVGDRVMHTALLCAASLNVLLFDYRGYGRSTGRPSELGTSKASATTILSLSPAGSGPEPLLTSARRVA
jgi:pimeloyl-ACP methyl ester carboxylesterase